MCPPAAVQSNLRSRLTADISNRPRCNTTVHDVGANRNHATLYKRSPELIEADLPFHNDQLDKLFRKIAWQAVVNNPLSDVTDKNGNGIGDEIE